MAIGAVVLLAVAAWTLVPSSDPDAPVGPDCGWDLTTPAGVQANSAYLTQTANWLANRDPASSAMPPSPTSPYWHGQCPAAPGDPPPPPIHEAHP